MDKKLRIPECNKVLLIGRIAHEPELKTINEQSKVAHFSLAVNKSYKDVQSNEWKITTSFIPVVVWGEKGKKYVERYEKGNAILVEGKIKSGSWTTEEGDKKSSIQVVADRIQGLEKKIIDKTNNLLENI
jgi:single-strand DNA-binding protein